MPKKTPEPEQAPKAAIEHNFNKTQLNERNLYERAHVFCISKRKLC